MTRPLALNGRIRDTQTVGAGQSAAALRKMACGRGSFTGGAIRQELRLRFTDVASGQRSMMRSERRGDSIRGPNRSLRSGTAVSVSGVDLMPPEEVEDVVPNVNPSGSGSISGCTTLNLNPEL